MIKATMCNWCSYRYRYDTTQSVTYCPICGAAMETDDIVPMHNMFEEDEVEESE